jgi:tetratricopeptide (TPR) repeat protein
VLHSVRLPGLLCFLLLPFIGMSRLDAQTTQPATKMGDLLAQCENNPDDATAMSACQTIIQDKAQTPEQHAAAYASAGFAALDEGQYSLALDYFHKALTFDPNSDAAYGGQAVVEFRLAQYDSAIADARKAIQLSPDTHPEAYLLIGTLADRDGDHDARIAYMTKAIAILPTYAEAYAGRGHGYMDERKYNQALDDFNEAISLKPTLASVLKPNFVIVYVERASNSMKRGEYQAGIKDLAKALQLDPENARALGDLGDAYDVTKQYDKAVVILTEDIAVNPDYFFAYTDLGIAYLNMGKDDLALTDLNKAIELGDNAYTTYFVRGEVYQRKSNNAAALADYQKSLELTPSDAPDPGGIQNAINSMEQ